MKKPKYKNKPGKEWLEKNACDDDISTVVVGDGVTYPNWDGWARVLEVTDKGFVRQALAGMLFNCSFERAEGVRIVRKEKIDKYLKQFEDVQEPRAT